MNEHACFRSKYRYSTLVDYFMLTMVLRWHFKLAQRGSVEFNPGIMLTAHWTFSVVELVKPILA